MHQHWIPVARRASARGFDTDTVLTTQMAQQMRALGYSFCLRYLPVEPSSNGRGDLAIDEVQRILNSGLALMAVQHVRLPGWRPARNLGLADGHIARVAAFRAGIPAHVNVWLDIEGVADGTSADMVANYINAWYEVVAAWGYRPGIYVGAASVLNASQLYHAIRMQHYWKSKSDVPTPIDRGYQMQQTRTNLDTCGITVDEDVTQADAFGDGVQWLINQP